MRTLASLLNFVFNTAFYTLYRSHHDWYVVDEVNVYLCIPVLPVGREFSM